MSGPLPPTGSADLPDGSVTRREREEEATLTERLRGGDEDAFTVLFNRHNAAMLRLALGFVASRAVAEEVVQDSWLGVVRGIERFEGRSSLRTWLFKIVMNRARTTGAREQRQQDVLMNDAFENPACFAAGGAWASPLPHWSETVEERLDAPATIALVHSAIAALPDLQRLVVLLRDVNGVSSSEVCDILSLQETHQRVLLHRGRTAIRRSIEAQMVEG